MSVPVSTGCEVNVAPREYKSGEMRTDLRDGDRARKVAFITGVTGQDGSYLVELLLSKGAEARWIDRPGKSSSARATRGAARAIEGARTRANARGTRCARVRARRGRANASGRRRGGKIDEIPERRAGEDARATTDEGRAIRDATQGTWCTESSGDRRRIIIRDWNTSWSRDTRTGRISFCTTAT
jgi:hypothetical protein